VEYSLKKASVLIRTKNEARGIGATLDAVFSQSHPPHEVFVIDSGSRDETLVIASYYPVTILTMSPRGWSYSRALNFGALKATGEFLVCLSAHSPPAGANWLANLLRHFDDPSVAAVWGPRNPKHPAGRTGRLFRQEPGSYTVQTRHWGLSNHNSALRRSLWLEFPFDEALPATEDKAWGAEAMARGYSIIFDPAAAVRHRPRPVLHEFRRNRAIQAGYKILFPELQLSLRSELTSLHRRAYNKLLVHVHKRDIVQLLLDARRLPSMVAGLLGRLLSRP
jgi:cellulose synthase/poly-beta-1,6-N-acetylglucosamine synthase-like glycosyltransferase